MNYTFRVTKFLSEINPVAGQHLFGERRSYAPPHRHLKSLHFKERHPNDQGDHILDRRHFIGGSDARIIMGKDEKALLRLWREKRGEEAPLDLSGVLIVQLGLVTEDLNRRWYELNSGHRISDIQRHAIHRTIPWMAATLDGLVKETGAVFEAKFMLPWSFSEEAAAEKHMAQLQHNMLVAGTKKSVLSIITGGGKWVELIDRRRPDLPDDFDRSRKGVLAGGQDR